MNLPLTRPAARRARAAASIVALVALATAALPAVSTRLVAAATTDTVTVDATTVAHTLPSTFFGANYVGFWDSAQGSAASASALAQTPIKTIRFAGGAPADWYDWADPYYQGWSSTSPLDLWHYAQQIGGRALFQTNYQGNGLPNPPGQSYAVNSPQNAAAWATYDMTAGISADMEVGNEEDVSMTTANDPSFQPYITAFNAQAQAIHAANPAVRVIGPAGTNEWYWWGLNSLGMFLQQTGNKSGSGQADGVSLHYYAGSGWGDTANAAQQWTAPGGPWQFIQNTIAANDSRNLPVYITEWNLGDSNTGTGFNQTLGHGLVVADMLGAFAQSGVAGEDYFAIHGGNSYGLLYGTGEAQAVDSPTPAYYATALWGHMGTQVLPLQQSVDPGAVMSTYATHAADGSYQILAINKQASPQPLAVQFNGIDPTGHHLAIYSLSSANTSPSVSDQSVVYDGVTNPSPQQPLPAPQDGGTVAGPSLSYTVPAYSAVVLTVDGGAASATMTPTPTVNPAFTATATSTSTPAPTVSASGSAAPQQIAPGQTLTLTATIGVTGSPLAGALVDLEVYDASYAKLCQPTFTAVSIAVGASQTFTAQCPLPANAALGTATFKIGVFGNNWSPLYTWNDGAATFTIGAPTTASPTPSGTSTPTSTSTPTDTSTPTATSTPTSTSTSTNTATPTATATRATVAHLVVSPARAVPFQTLALIGTGFLAGQKVRVSLDSITGTALLTPTVNAVGIFTATLRAAEAISGTHALFAAGLPGGPAAVTALQVRPELILAPSTGTIGATVTALGFGLGRNEPVRLYWDRPLTLLGTTASSGVGSFYGRTARVFHIPTGAAVGHHYVLAIGLYSGARAYAAFTVR